MGHTKTNEEYIAGVIIVNPNIEPIEDYKGCNTKIWHHCKICDNKWKVSPSNVLKGYNCPKCANAAKCRSHEQYVKELELVNPNIEVLETYVNRETYILHKCKIDGYEWKTKPKWVLNEGKGCPKCGGKMKKTQEEYIKLLAEVRPDIEVMDMYINTKTKISHRCKKCGYVWMEKPNVILQGLGCPNCPHPLQKTHKQYVLELAERNSDIDVIEPYVGSQTHILHCCKKCGYQWSPTPNSILQGKGCPQCSTSIGEKMIKQYLDDNSINYFRQYRFEDCRDTYPMPFDFYLPDYNLCIEYDGEQHFMAVEYWGGEKTFQLCQKHDKMKTEYCDNNHIALLRISYKEDIVEKLNEYFTQQNNYNRKELIC